MHRGTFSEVLNVFFLQTGRSYEKIFWHGSRLQRKLFLDQSTFNIGSFTRI